MKKVILLVVMLLVSTNTFADKFNYDDFMGKLNRMVPDVKTQRQYESDHTDTVRYEVYERQESAPQANVYQPPAYQYVQPPAYQYVQPPAYQYVQAQRKVKAGEGSDWLIPLLIVGLAILVGDGFAIWYLHKRLFADFSYDILSPGKLFLFGAQTLPLVALLLKSGFRLTVTDAVFGLGFFVVIAGVQFYMDKRNTSLKYAFLLLLVRTLAAVFVAVVVAIIILILFSFMWAWAGRKKDDELSAEEVSTLKKLAGKLK